MTKPIKYELKSWPIFFNEILSGKKTHEVRRSDDREFIVGDHLRLNEWEPQTKSYTGRSAVIEITYITDESNACAYSPVALKEGFSILSVKLLNDL